MSLICADPNRTFEWYKPTVAHHSWNVGHMVRNTARWVDHLARGKNDRRKTKAKAVHVDGGTVGPAKEGAA